MPMGVDGTEVPQSPWQPRTIHWSHRARRPDPGRPHPVRRSHSHQQRALTDDASAHDGRIQDERIQDERIQDERTRPSQSRIATSFGVVVAGLDPAEAASLVAEMQDAVPSASRQEYLVLDDHADSDRRALVTALEGVGDAMRLVPRPSQGRAAEYDALSLSSRSELLVVAINTVGPFPALEDAVGHMWSEGADVVSILGRDVSPGKGDDGALLAQYLGLRATESGGPLGARTVIIRRWVARWLFSETDRALDAADEVADRARLLGLNLLVVDHHGDVIR